MPPTVRKSSLGAGMSLPTARVQIVNLLQTPGSKTKALGSGNCPQRLTRIVTGCPAPHLRGGRSVRIRAELCKHAHSPFLLPSAGLNANSKYLHRTVMENSNKYSAEIIQN